MCITESNARRFLVLLFCAGFFLLACETASLITGNGDPREPSNPAQESAVPPTRSQQELSEFVPADTPRCSPGIEEYSVVDGQITQDGSPVVAQQLVASSGPGGDPIPSTPVESDENGTFQVPFICDESACNGSYWLWVINDDGEQVSPFVQFNFDNQCRRGTVNFMRR